MLSLCLVSGCSGSLDDPASGDVATGTAPVSTTSPLEPDDRPRAGGRLVVGVPADVNGWNPNINQWTDGGTIMGPSMLEPLVTISAEGEAEPWLAEAWLHSADYRSWALTVREGVRFHNGQLLDANAVKRSLDAYALTGLSSVALKPLYERVDVVDPRTVLIHLKTPWAQYPSSLSSAYMLAPAMLDRPDEGTTFPIGTGPFRFVEWQVNTHLKVTRWDNYWRRDRDGGPLPHLDGIEFRPILADDARQDGMVDGDLDIALTSSPATARALEDRHTVIRDYATERTMLILNVEEGKGNAPNPFTNLHARRALAHATDSHELARLVGEGVQVTTQGYRSDSRWGLPTDETNYPGYDPVAARREIDLYKRDTGGRDIRFVLKSVPEPKLMAVLQRVQAQWRDVGIEATIETMDQVQFSIIVALGQFHAAYYRGYGDSNPDQSYWFLTPRQRASRRRAVAQLHPLPVPDARHEPADPAGEHRLRRAQGGQQRHHPRDQ